MLSTELVPKLALAAPTTVIKKLTPTQYANDLRRLGWQLPGLGTCLGWASCSLVHANLSWGSFQQPRLSHYNQSEQLMRLIWIQLTFSEEMKVDRGLWKGRAREVSLALNVIGRSGALGQTELMS
ncbi:hypothetical protein PMIN07_010003 [Paraphaeosphaeria minitans]